MSLLGPSCRGRLAALAVVTCLGACKKSPPPPPDDSFVVPHLGLLIPRQAGWQLDPDVPTWDPSNGGVAIRLVTLSAVAGSPRVEVTVDPPAPEHPTTIEEFLGRNLAAMGQLESSAPIRINQVQQRRVTVGHKPGYRVQHDYTLTHSAAPVAITQVSVFVVTDGRGVAVTAAGRAELFHPHAEAIEVMLQGLHFENEPRSPAPLPPGVAPVDLGQVGGGPKGKGP